MRIYGQLWIKMIWFSIVPLLIACRATKPDGSLNKSIPSLLYHNTTAHYNRFFNGKMKYLEAVKNIENNYKYDFNEILPIYLSLDVNQNKAEFQKFDETVKKMSIAITDHKNSRWVDDCFFYIGLARFYKGDYFSAAQSFAYLLTEKRFEKTKYKNDCAVWLAKSKIAADDNLAGKKIIDEYLSKKNIPKRIRKDFYVLNAFYFAKQKNYPLVIENLEQAVKLTRRRKEKNHYYFILGQLYVRQGQKNKAFEAFTQAMKRNTHYEFTFNAKLGQVHAYLADTSNKQNKKVTRTLKRMIADDKNSDNYDQIYYELGNIEVRNKNYQKAIHAYKKSAKLSTKNAYQKGLAYNKLGDVYFSPLNKFVLAEAYYDSAAAAFKSSGKANQESEKAEAIKKNLSDYVKYTKIIREKDSLIQFSLLPQKEQYAIIDAIIKKKEKELQKQEEKKNSGSNFIDPMRDDLPKTTFNTTGGTFYFDNPAVVAQGKAEFKRLWGDRVYGDNWKYSEGIKFEDFSSNANNDPNKNTNDPKNKPKNPLLMRETYLKNVPKNDAERNKMLAEVEEAMYQLGNTFYIGFNMPDSAQYTFENTLKRFPDTKYKPSIYFSLYGAYKKLNNPQKAEYYKNLLIQNYPDHEYTQLIMGKANKQVAFRDSMNQLYAQAIALYENKEFERTIALCDQVIRPNPKNEEIAKFHFLRAYAYKELDKPDSLIAEYRFIDRHFPKAPFIGQVRGLLATLEKNKENISKVTLEFDPEVKPTDKIVVFLYIDSKKNLNTAKIKIADFNSKFYSTSNLMVNDNIYNDTLSLIYISTFPDKRQAKQYAQQLKNDPSMKDFCNSTLNNVFVITNRNLNTLIYKPVPNDGIHKEYENGRNSLEVFIKFYQEYEQDN
ncbi:MAG: tetratricopeptide repeat protein [Bacteroidia bacterium]|nr:tetratricopeptide repeat protein [Bacteroidia bacterium]MDW8302265.1 tetratricopeptide repeat protein [Bacteroidia bacterium]